MKNFLTSFGGLLLAVGIAYAATNLGSDISTDGTLTVNGALKFTSGAGSNYLMSSDLSGNAAWVTATSVVDPRISALKGVANGIAGLDAFGKINKSDLPGTLINTVYSTSSEAGMLALPANPGDLAIRTDLEQTFILSTSTPTVLANWVLLLPSDGHLDIAANLSDLSDKAAARNNLSLGTSSSPTFTGLTLSGGSLSINGLAYTFPSSGGLTGQVLASNGSNILSWVTRANSGANSDITSLSGLTTPLSVLQGGTGSTTSSGARTNLGAAASGANSDITSLSGLTTPLSIAQGGTGTSSPDATGAAVFAGGTHGNNVSNNNTYYFELNNSGGLIQADTITSRSLMVRHGTIRNLYIVQSGNAGKTNTYTIRKNGVDQTLTCSILSGATTCSNTSNTVSVVPGDEVGIKIVTGNGGSTVSVIWGVELSL